MGGRGGKSGIRGGGSTGESLAINAKMPQLTGSDKQIKWANDIRESALKNADHLVKNAEASKNLGMQPDSVTPSVEGSKFARRELVERLQKVTSAPQIINARNGITYESIKEVALYDDKRNNRRRKY